MQMDEYASVRAFWGGRVEPLETQARMVWECWRRLAARGDFLSLPWRSLNTRPEGETPLDTFESLLSDMSDAPETDWPGFGFSQDLAAIAQRSPCRATLSVTLSLPRLGARGLGKVKSHRVVFFWAGRGSAAGLSGWWLVRVWMSRRVKVSDRWWRSPCCHSSCWSMRTASASLATDGLSGKIWTTSERRLVSRLTRSMGLSDQILCQCPPGMAANAVGSGSLASSVAAIWGNRPDNAVVTWSCVAVTASGVSGANTVEMSALTGSGRSAPSARVTSRAQ